MHPNRRLLLRSLAAAPLLQAPRAFAQAGEAFPSHPVRIVVWAGPGSAFDTLARFLAEQLGQRWKQNVVVENKVGAGGILGTDFVARAKPDGYTLLITTTSAHILNPLLKAKLPFDVARDFAPVSKIAEGQTALAVAQASPYNTLGEFLAAAKASPKGLSYSSFAIGSASHLMGEHLARASQARLVHVPYAGGEMAALTDLLGGNLDSSFMSQGTAIAQQKAGKVKLLALTGQSRLKTLPNVPTYAEQGLSGFDLTGWIGAFVPAGTPRPVVAQWSGALQEIIRSASFEERMAPLGFDAVGSTPEAFATAYQSDFERWRELVRGSGMVAQ